MLGALVQDKDSVDFYEDHHKRTNSHGSDALSLMMARKNTQWAQINNFQTKIYEMNIKEEKEKKKRDQKMIKEALSNQQSEQNKIRIKFQREEDRINQQYIQKSIEETAKDK